jgi:hypothetical protein
LNTVEQEKLEMKTPIVELVLIGLLLMTVISPFAGLAPLMIILFGYGIFWMLWSLIQAFFTADLEGDDDQARFKSSRGE